MDDIDTNRYKYIIVIRHDMSWLRLVCSFLHLN